MIRGKVFPKEKKTLNYYVMYDKPIRDLYNVITIFGDRKSAKSMGVLLSLIPFIKVSTNKKKQGKVGSNNSLVMSEWDNKNNRYKPLTKYKLSKALNVSPSNLETLLGVLNNKSKEITGQYLLYEIKPSGIKDLKKNIMVINPLYTYTEGTGTNQFNVLEQWLNEADKQIE